MIRERKISPRPIDIEDFGERWAEERGNDVFLLSVQEAWELGRAVNRRCYGDLPADGLAAGREGS